jgi:hypothetical protein
LAISGRKPPTRKSFELAKVVRFACRVPTTAPPLFQTVDPAQTLQPSSLRVPRSNPPHTEDGLSLLFDDIP